MKVLQQQHWHLLSLLALLAIVYFLIAKDASMLQGELFGISSSTYLLVTILVPILHQVYVLVCWRTELHYQSLTNLFGDKGFLLFKVGFGLLFVSRLISIIFLAYSNEGSLNMNSTIASVMGGLVLFPALYLFYSVKRYFGVDRAFGIDHFRPEEMKHVPFVKKGAFRLSPNAMYVFGFFILWVPGLLLLSKAALIAAAFNHLSIWVHYYFTELPDIKVIYGD